MPRDLKIRGYTVGQHPNRPLWVALVALIVALLTHGGGTVNNVARAVLFVAVAVWGWEEATDGVNGFRKGLGVVALVALAAGIALSLR